LTASKTKARRNKANSYEAVRRNGRSRLHEPGALLIPDANERGLTAGVAATLGREIVSGVHPVGAILAEPKMLSRFAISRTALREAYRVLSAKGMIVARQKVGTRVRPVAEWNALDPEVLAWHLQAAPKEKVVEDLFTVRKMIEPEAAAIAAAARSPVTVRRLEDAYTRMVQYRHGEGDLVAADLEFHMVILEARNNPFLAALGALINTSLQAVFKYSWQGAARIKTERLHQHEEVCLAIRNGDPHEARRRMMSLLEDSIQDIRKVLRPPRSRENSRLARTK
jgi:GntR family transcriptional regulator, galactonate operon transcriptional repressor